MKLFSFARRKKCRGFSLVEVTLALGILAFGFLSLVPLLGLGLVSARQARDVQTSTRIAETFMEEARQGLAVVGPGYFDDQGRPCADTKACYRTQATLGPAPLGNDALTNLTVRVTPVATPTRSQFYAVVLSPQ